LDLFFERDETSTLESQLLSIQTQLTATETRLESVTQTAENAMEREREAEDKFDASLSLHARQLSQRQVRMTWKDIVIIFHLNY
jgi:hypothetical protein